jgi:hypothetical protein
MFSCQSLTSPLILPVIVLVIVLILPLTFPMICISLMAPPYAPAKGHNECSDDK